MKRLLRILILVIFLMSLFNVAGDSSAALIPQYGSIEGTAKVAAPSFYLDSNVNQDVLLINKKPIAPDDESTFGITSLWRTFKTRELGGVNFNYAPTIQFSVRASATPNVATPSPSPTLVLSFGYYKTSDTYEENPITLCSATMTLDSSLSYQIVDGNCAGEKPTNVKRFFYAFTKGSDEYNYTISRYFTDISGNKVYTGVKITNE